MHCHCIASCIAIGAVRRYLARFSPIPDSVHMKDYCAVVFFDDFFSRHLSCMTDKRQIDMESVNVFKDIAVVCVKMVPYGRLVNEPGCGCRDEQYNARLYRYVVFLSKLFIRIASVDSADQRVPDWGTFAEGVF